MFQLRGTLPFFRIYRDSILADALARFVNLEQRADSVAEAAFKRVGSRPAADDSGDMDQEAEYRRRRRARRTTRRWPASGRQRST